jgi:hypothetical protein
MKPTAARAPTQTTTDVRVFASIGSMADVREALRARFDALELARTTIDAAAGLADGHASKLLAGLKHFGDVSLFPTIEVAGLRLVLIEDEEATARSAKLQKRVAYKVRYAKGTCDARSP